MGILKRKKLLNSSELEIIKHSCVHFPVSSCLCHSEYIFYLLVITVKAQFCAGPLFVTVNNFHVL